MMDLNDLAASARSDQTTALAAEIAAVVAAYYLRTRQAKVPTQPTLALTLQFQAAYLAKIFGLEMSNE